MTEPTGAAHRRGPLREGDRVQLTDPKGRMHTITLTAGKSFFTHKGSFTHAELIGQPEGCVVRNTASIEYLVVRPLLADYVLSMPRGAAVVYPKDAGQVVTMGDVFPGACVVEAGVGSGALAMSLLRAVGDDGCLHSFERRADFAEIARTNVETFFGMTHPAWTLTVGDLVPSLTALMDEAEKPLPSNTSLLDTALADDRSAPDESRELGDAPEPVVATAADVRDDSRDDPAAEAGVSASDVSVGPRGHALRAGTVDRVVLDMLAPWECLDAVSRALAPGGVLVVYVATATQLSKVAEAIRDHGTYTEPAAWESLVRGWHLEGLAVRPEHRMIGHTGFLLSTRRLADGVSPPARRRRPAKGAYGEPVTESAATPGDEPAAKVRRTPLP